MEPQYLVLRASGGLSNRIQIVLAGIAYCLLTGRILHVDWRDGLYSDGVQNAFGRCFSLGIPHCTELPSGTVWPPFWQDMLANPNAVEYLFENNEHLAPENLERTSIDFSRLDYPEPVLVGWGVDLKPALQIAPLLRQKEGYAGLDDRALLRTLHQRYLHCSDAVNTRVESFAEQHFRGHTLGVHIRHTDLQSPLDAFIDFLQTAVQKKKSTLFLCTDNAQVQKTLCRIFPDVCVTEKFLPENGVPLHSHFVNMDNGYKAVEALTDMYLLARCHEIVYYRPSSFARVPVLLAGLPADCVHSLG